MRIEFEPKIFKELKKIDKTQAKKIIEKIEDLKKYPDVPNIKKLNNYDPTHRLRIGDYRVLFSIKDDCVVIGKIKHRKEAY